MSRFLNHSLAAIAAIVIVVSSFGAIVTVPADPGLAVVATTQIA